MRRFASTLVMVLALAGLLGYIYFVDNKRPAGGVETKEKAFGDVKAEDIEKVSIKAEGGELSRLQKAGDAWTLVEPVRADADGGELASITGSLSTLEIDRVVDENATDLKQYALDPARLEISFTLKGQSQPKRILLGGKTPTGSGVYAQLPDRKRVFLVSSYLDTTFNKSPFALRDKLVLKFDRAKADGLEITSGTTTLQFAKKGTDWMLVKPFAARADYGAVEGALERLASAQMQSITAQDVAGDAATYGLVRPSATMVVTSGSARTTLVLGRTENAVVFAKDASRPMVFTVAPTITTDIVKDAGDYRRKDLFDFRSFTAARVEFRRGTETMLFEKSKGKDGAELWKTAAGKDADAMKLDDLLAKVSALRATSFDAAAHASLKAPVLTVTASFDGRTETVTFGRAAADVFASRTDEPGSARLDAATLDDAVKALDALK